MSKEEAPQEPVPLRTRRRRQWWTCAVVVLAVSFLGVTLGAGWVWWLLHALPDEETIRSYRPPVATEVRDVQGRFLFSVTAGVSRLWRPLASISPWLIKAVITSEDDTFFQHEGIRPEAIKEALAKDWKMRRWARGASTITQQLAKNAFLSREKTVSRKLREIVLARRIEKVLSKQRILELYLNVVEWGDGVYGAEAAARYYFGKPASAITLPEAAMLAGMLPNPKFRNPFVRYERVMTHQRRVLHLMRNNGVITAEEYEWALQQPVELNADGAKALRRSLTQSGDCFVDTLVRYLRRKVGEARLFSGQPIVVTIDLDVQRALSSQIGDGGPSLAVARRQGKVVALVCADSTQAETFATPRSAWIEGQTGAELADSLRMQPLDPLEGCTLDLSNPEELIHEDLLLSKPHL
ncbi:MAG: monofunctional biosynthetic peptidoglycan transglycosylase [Candidatus Oleimicrobiaceae bacterium]